MRVLICTIVRDRVKSLDRWRNQLLSLLHLHPEHNFSLAVYENDSHYGTDEWLLEMEEQGDFSLFDNCWITSETLVTPSFGSIVNEERVVNLANARNKCMAQANLTNFDWVLWVESDVEYDPQQVSRLFAQADSWDILSGATYLGGGKFYDTWATRQNADEEWWPSKVNPKKLCSETEILPLTSTFNGVCLYQAVGFQKGAQFSGHSEHLGKFDCDTAVVCEQFRALGFDKIGMDPYFEVKV